MPKHDADSRRAKATKISSKKWFEPKWMRIMLALVLLTPLATNSPRILPPLNTPPLRGTPLPLSRGTHPLPVEHTPPHETPLPSPWNNPSPCSTTLPWNTLNAFQLAFLLQCSVGRAAETPKGGHEPCSCEGVAGPASCCHPVREVAGSFSSDTLGGGLASNSCQFGSVNPGRACLGLRPPNTAC